MAEDHLTKLRRLRVKPEPDLTLSFLKRQFKTEVEKPFKQLQGIAPLWQELVPADLLAHTRLESLRAGVLRVKVDSSARLYELDRLLRGGLQRELITRHKGPAIRRVQLVVSG